MGETGEIIRFMTRYLEQSTQPINGLDWLTQYGIPIIQTIVLIGGAIAGLYKFYSMKNKEVSEKILKEVYAPLFQYFVKQELYLFVNEKERNKYESPILELSSEKTTYKGLGSEKEGVGHEVSIITETVLNLDRNEFLKVLDSVNIGLASKELYTLLSMYQVLIYIEGKSKETSIGYLNSTIMKVDVENALRTEIMKGYSHHHKKLGLKTLEPSRFYEIRDNDIVFTYEVDKARKEKLLSKIIKKAK